MAMVRTEHDIVSQVQSAKTDAEAADALIRQYMGFIRSETVKFLHTAPENGHEDELSIAMLAFYEAVLAFSKKNLADRRFTFTFTRKWTEEDMMDYLNEQSISPSYSQLIDKMEGYEGRIMDYKAYIVDISESGDMYIIRMALNRKNDEYSNIILVTSEEKPNFQVDERVMMYGTCAGMSLSTGVEGEEEDPESYPCFELLLFASLE